MGKMNTTRYYPHPEMTFIAQWRDGTRVYLLGAILIVIKPGEPGYRSGAN
jgi:hypothetical protein